MSLSTLITPSIRAADLSDRFPTVIKGGDLPWVNTPGFDLDKIYLYRFNGPQATPQFTPIPFQIDKRRRVHYLHNAITKSDFAQLSVAEQSKLVDVCFYGYFPPDQTICNSWTGAGVSSVRDCVNGYMPEWANPELKREDEIVFMARDAIGGVQDICPPAHWLDSGGAPGLFGARLEIKFKIGTVHHWVYAYYWTETPPANLRASDPAPTFQSAACTRCTGPEAVNNDNNICGRITAEGDGSLAGYQTNFKSNWLVDEFKVRKNASSNDDLIAALTMRAQQETDYDWACYGYPRKHGVLSLGNGTVRSVVSRQGAKSGFATVRVDKFYDTFSETEIEFRAHELPATGVTMTQDQDAALAPSAGDPKAAVWTETSYGLTPKKEHDRIFSSPFLFPPGSGYTNAPDDWVEMSHETKGGTGVYLFEDPNRGPIPAETNLFVYQDDTNVHGSFGRKWEKISCMQDGIGNDGGCGSGDPEGSDLRFKRIFRRTIPLENTGNPFTSGSVLTDDYATIGEGGTTKAEARQQTQSACSGGGGGAPCIPIVSVQISNDGSTDISNSPGSAPSGCIPTDTAGYGITRQYGSGPEVQIAVVGTGGTYKDRMTKWGQPHTYRSHSFNWRGVESAKSSPVTVTPLDTSVPPPPTISATAIIGGATVDIDKCVGLDSFAVNLYVSTTSGGPYTQVNTAPIYAQGTAHFTVSGLQNGVTYYIAGKLLDYAGNLSAYSNQVSVTPSP